MIFVVPTIFRDGWMRRAVSVSQSRWRIKTSLSSTRSCWMWWIDPSCAIWAIKFRVHYKKPSRVSKSIWLSSKNTRVCGRPTKFVFNFLVSIEWFILILFTNWMILFQGGCVWKVCDQKSHHSGVWRKNGLLLQNDRRNNKLAQRKGRRFRSTQHEVVEREYGESLQRMAQMSRTTAQWDIATTSFRNQTKTWGDLNRAYSRFVKIWF